jgi:hypothetical protein
MPKNAKKNAKNAKKIPKNSKNARKKMSRMPHDSPLRNFIAFVFDLKLDFMPSSKKYTLWANLIENMVQ